MSNDFYGDSFRWFVGVVEDNNDPLHLGRVRVRIRGLHSTARDIISTSDLPWAQVSNSASEPGVSGMSSTIQLQPGAQVIGFFLDGIDAQLPMILGVIGMVELATPIQRDNFSTSELGPESITSSTGQGTGITGERNKSNPNTLDVFGATGDSNPEIAYNFFITQGFTPNQSAGVVGNLMQESGPRMSTTIKSAGSERSFGIAQWNSSKAAGNRLGLLKDFANDVGKSWTDLTVQLRFIIWELENYGYLGLSELKSARTVEAATRAFALKYERPSDVKLSNRISYAKDILKRMNS